jgi:hypothetical protein
VTERAVPPPPRLPDEIGRGQNLVRRDQHPGADALHPVGLHFLDLDDIIDVSAGKPHGSLFAS